MAQERLWGITTNVSGAKVWCTDAIEGKMIIRKNY